MRFIWPLDNHYITRGFDYKSNIYIGGQHAGLDLVRLQGDTAGVPIRAVVMGVVVETAWDKYSGHYIVLDHDRGWRSKYRHMVGPAPLAVGQPVVQGQTVGKVGSTGLSTGPHLHLDLWHREKQDDTAFYKQGWWAHDPALYLGKEEDDMTPEEIREIMREELKPVKDELATVKRKVEATYNQVNSKAGVVLNGILDALRRITVKWDV